MLFQSRTAQVSVFQGEDELPGTRAGHGGYDFTIACKAGEVTVRFTNTTTDTVNAKLGKSTSVPVAPGASHDFNVTLAASDDMSLAWGTRSAHFNFEVAA